MRLGLKCGGNLKERANRLFQLKINPSNLFNDKFFSKKKEKKNKTKENEIRKE